MTTGNPYKEMLRGDDLYPSRVFPAPSIQARLDPVVYGLNEDSPLTREQLGFYENFGFIQLESVFDETEVELFNKELWDIRGSKRLKSCREAFTEKGSNELRSLFKMHELSAVFGMLASDNRILDVVRYILGGDVYIHQSRLNFKPGFKGREFYWHSDFETWHVEDGMPRMRAVSVSIALSENTEFNGPLMLIPGSHKAYVSCIGETPDDHYKESLRKQECGIPDAASLRYLEEKSGIVAPKPAPGSILIFDCNLMHGSNSNISPHPRSNAFFVYNSLDNKLHEPFCGKHYRPEFVAARDHCCPLIPVRPNYIERYQSRGNFRI